MNAPRAPQSTAYPECRCGEPVESPGPGACSAYCAFAHNFPHLPNPWKTMERSTQGSVEFYTPRPYVEAARATMGAIDLDPATCDAGQLVVNATVALSEADDGLALASQWAGRVWLNPPGGRAPEHLTSISRSHQAVWWAALANAWRYGDVEQAVFLAYSIELLAVAQGIDCPQPMDFPFVVVAKRIAFDAPDGRGGRTTTDAPKYANTMVYLPPKGEGYYTAEKRFREACISRFACRAPLQDFT